MTITRERSIAPANAPILSVKAFGAVFRITTSATAKPARLSAFAVSYSQFVPGNTGTTAVIKFLLI
jgi:hypothetical protein